MHDGLRSRKLVAISLENPNKNDVSKRLNTNSRFIFSVPKQFAYPRISDMFLSRSILVLVIVKKKNLSSSLLFKLNVLPGLALCRRYRMGDFCSVNGRLALDMWKEFSSVTSRSNPWPRVHRIIRSDRTATAVEHNYY